MAIYSIANRTSNVTIANATLEVRSAATARPKVLELGYFLGAATASTVGLGRPAAIGVTPTSPQTVLGEDPADPAGSTTTALAWATGPTVPANFFRRIGLPATIGTGVIWTFPRGLGLPVSNSVVVWNISATGVADIYAVVDE